MARTSDLGRPYIPNQQGGYQPEISQKPGKPPNSGGSGQGGGGSQGGDGNGGQSGGGQGIGGQKNS
jgi:hypothetical protein